jgi:uncharacterized protein with HEPN domain
MLVFALVHALQTAGEAAGKVSAETRDQSPEIPWASMIGMRHRLVHAYFDINLDILWTTASEAAPASQPRYGRFSIESDPEVW